MLLPVHWRVYWCCTSFRVSRQGSVANLSAGVQVKELINRMKNFTITTMGARGKAVTEKAYDDQLLNERLDAGIIPKIAPDIFEIVHPAEPQRYKPERVASNNNPEVEIVLTRQRHCGALANFVYVQSGFTVVCDDGKWPLPRP